MKKTRLFIRLGLLLLAAGLGMQALTTSPSPALHFLKGLLIGAGAGIVLYSVIASKRASQ